MPPLSRTLIRFTRPTMPPTLIHGFAALLRARPQPLSFINRTPLQASSERYLSSYFHPHYPGDLHHQFHILFRDDLPESVFHERVQAIQDYIDTIKVADDSSDGTTRDTKEMQTSSTTTSDTVVQTSSKFPKPWIGSKFVSPHLSGTDRILTEGSNSIIIHLQ